jgi:hypothetical protein
MVYSSSTYLKAKLVAALFWIPSTGFYTRLIIDICPLDVHYQHKDDPSAGCVSAANSMRRDDEFFGKHFAHKHC